MAQATEARSSSPSTNQSMQDVFLNHARRARAEVVVHLMDGRQFATRIKNFDKFAIIVDGEGGDHLIFKHAIASIESTQVIANYFPSPQS
jgi:host factor-I protein